MIEHIKERSLSAKDIADLAVCLKGLPEFSNRTIDELLEIACKILLRADDWRRFALQSDSQQQWKNFHESVEEISTEEAAKLVTGQSRADRALEWFGRFRKFLSESKESKDLFGEEELDFLSRHFKEDQLLFRKADCLLLAKRFPFWREWEESRLQRRRGRKTKFPKKV